MQSSLSRRNADAGTPRRYSGFADSSPGSPGGQPVCPRPGSSDPSPCGGVGAAKSPGPRGNRSLAGVGHVLQSPRRTRPWGSVSAMREEPMLLDLSHALATGMTQVANVPPVDVCRILSIDDGAWANAQSRHITGHSGTHVDAPLHVLAGTASIEQLPLERFIGPGVALTLLKDPGTTIVATDLEAANGGRVRRGDIVLLHTGWDRYWGTPTYFDFPALTLDAADWLLEHGVRLVGMDMLSPDLPA